jgi:hypothetical protein
VQQLDPSPRRRGLAVVELEQAAESLATLHWACSAHCRPWRDELVPQNPVRPFFMIMVNKFSYGRPKTSFADLRGLFCGLQLMIDATTRKPADP